MRRIAICDAKLKGAGGNTYHAGFASIDNVYFEFTRIISGFLASFFDGHTFQTHTHRLP